MDTGVDDTHLGNDEATVVVVVGSLNVGGTERHLVRLLPLLVQRGLRVTVYCLSERGELAAKLEAAGIAVVESHVGEPMEWMSRPRRAGRVALKVLALARFLRTRRPAIVHFYLPYAYLLGAPAAILARVPVRVMSRRSLNDYQKGHWGVAQVERLFHHTMSAVVGNSRRVVEQLRGEGVPPQGSALIYNGVALPAPVQESREAVRNAMSVPQDSLVLVIVANLIPYKGHTDLIDALVLAAPRMSRDWRLLVVGRDDGIGADLCRQVDALGLRENVLFLGPRQDVAVILQCADIAVLTSHEEGFSNAILEYMAAGLPVIASDVGGNPEAVVDGKSGLIVPARDPKRLADAIVRLANDPDLAVRFGRNGKQRAERCFGEAACADGYVTLYRALLASRPLDTIPALHPDTGRRE